MKDRGQLKGFYWKEEPGLQWFTAQIKEMQLCKRRGDDVTAAIIAERITKHPMRPDWDSRALIDEYITQGGYVTKYDYVEPEPELDKNMRHQSNRKCIATKPEPWDATRQVDIIETTLTVNTL